MLSKNYQINRRLYKRDIYIAIYIPRVSFDVYPMTDKTTINIIIYYVYMHGRRSTVTQNIRRIQNINITSFEIFFLIGKNSY